MAAKEAQSSEISQFVDKMVKKGAKTAQKVQLCPECPEPPQCEIMWKHTGEQKNLDRIDRNFNKAELRILAN